MSYHEEGWERKLLGLVREGEKNTAFFDAIVDGAGGDIVEKGAKILKVSSTSYPASSMHISHTST